MSRTYLRFEPDDQFGAICSAPGCVLSHCGRFVIQPLFDQVVVSSLSTFQSVSKTPLNKDAYITAMQLHPAYNSVALGCSDCAVRVLNTDTQQLTEFSTEARPTCVAWSGDGSLLIVGCANGQVQTFDAADQTELRRPERFHQQAVTGLVLVNGKLVSAAQDRTIVVYEGAKRVQTMADLTCNCVGLAVSNGIISAMMEDGSVQMLGFDQAAQAEPTEEVAKLVGELKGEIPILSAQKGLVRLSVHERPSPLPGRMWKSSGIFTVSTKKAVEFYEEKDDKDIKTHAKQRITRTFKQRVERVEAQRAQNKLSADGQLEVSQLLAPIPTVMFTDIFKLVTTVPSHQTYVTTAVRYPNSNSYKTLISTPTMYEIGELANNEYKATRDNKAFNSPPTAVCLNEEDTLIAMADPNALKIYSVRTCQCLSTVELPDNLGQPTSLHILKGGLYAVVLSARGMCCIVNLLQSEVENLIQISESNKKIVGSQLLNDSLVVFCEEGAIRYYSFTIQQQQLQLMLERDLDAKSQITCGLITSDFVAFGCLDNSIKIHYADTFKYKMTLYGHALPVTQLQLSPTNERLFSISADKTVRAWGLTFGECLKQIKLQEAPTAFALITSTHLVLIADKAGCVSYYDLDSYVKICQLSEGNYGKRLQRGHFAPVRGLAMARSGRFAVTVAADGGRTWLQSNDLVSIEDEAAKTAAAKDQLTAENLEWGQKLRAEAVTMLDQLQETVEGCYSKFSAHGAVVVVENAQVSADVQTATQAELLRMAQRIQASQEQRPWQLEIVEFLVEKCPRSVLPDLMRALPVSSAEKLRKLLIELVTGGNKQEQIAWVLLRLLRTVFNGKGAEVSKTLATNLDNLKNCISACAGAIRGTLEE